MKQNKIPIDGLAGLKQNFSSDALSGFLVFLLALPLSLGIAQASDFPAVYGLVTAMVGGVVVSLLAGSPLTIKGPAAGLIVIVAGAVAELGQGDLLLGWKLTLGCIVVVGVIQMVLGLLKLVSFTDYIPHSLVHGMLAAIGIIIISKQVHTLFGITPKNTDGSLIQEPLQLLLEVGNTVKTGLVHGHVALIGFISLTIIFVWPYIRIGFLRRIPSALVVLALAIFMVQLFDIRNTPAITDAEGNIIHPSFSPLLNFNQELSTIIDINVSFDGCLWTLSFWKYVLMFTVVGTLESLLTVRAMDAKDPWKRKSDSNRDIIAIGAGNIISGIIGGLPMISEVARSSANITNGARTRWSNFFHGIFILLFLVFEVSFSDLIPKAALAAMLIGVGWKLAHPREFGIMARTGNDQFFFFLSVIIVTLMTDIMIGILAGVVLKLLYLWLRGISIMELIKVRYTYDNGQYIVRSSLVFTNISRLKRQLMDSTEEDITLDISQCSYIDHTAHELILQLQDDLSARNKKITIIKKPLNKIEKQ